MIFSVITSKGASVLDNTFRSSLTTIRTSPAQTITTECTAEKCFNEWVQSKQALPQTEAMQSNRRMVEVQANPRCQSSKKQFKQQRQRRLRNGIISNYQTHKTKDSFCSPILSEISQTAEYGRQPQKLEKEVLKIGLSFDYAECGYITSLFCDLL